MRNKDLDYDIPILKMEIYSILLGATVSFKSSFCIDLMTQKETQTENVSFPYGFYNN